MANWKLLLGSELSRTLLIVFVVYVGSTVVGLSETASALTERHQAVALAVEDSSSDQQQEQRHTVELKLQKPDPCRSSISAMSVIREEYHIFSGKWFWRVNEQKGVVADDPMEIHLMWYLLPLGLTHVDAVYERSPNGKIVFFIGSFYWELDDNRSGKFPRSGRPLGDLGLSEEVDHVDAAFVWPKDNRTYLVIGDQLWRLNASGSGIEGKSQRLKIDQSSRIGSSSIDAAFKDLEGKVHFLQGGYYWTVTDLENLTTTTRELKNESAIFGCNRPVQMDSLRSSSAQIPPPETLPLAALLFGACMMALLGSNKPKGDF